MQVQRAMQVQSDIFRTGLSHYLHHCRADHWRRLGAAKFRQAQLLFTEQGGSGDDNGAVCKSVLAVGMNVV
jgi:hypothetical protein